jgi:UDP-GlcNAc:undecaprenyl-phosphate GlcNAc-1-phosphate transferase
MQTAAVAFVISLAAGAALTPLARRLAHRIGAIDHVLSSRKVHIAPIPRLGGLAIVGAFFAPLVGLCFTGSDVGRLFLADEHQVIGLVVGGLAIVALGVYDDIFGLGARAKFTVQFAVAAFVYAMGYRIDEIANPFGAPVQLGVLGLPFTMLWVAGVINAMNLIDGLDGLAGGVAVICVATTFVAAVWQGEPLMALCMAALGGAILGFLRYNFNPASIFMGDTGSMFLGFVLATTATQTHHKSSTAVAILVPIVALGLPITDTLLAMARRYLRGAPLFHADREHIHHRLLALGLTHRQTVLVLYGASVVLAAAALVLACVTGVTAALVLAALVLCTGLVLRGLGYLRFEGAAEVLEIRRRNLDRRASVRGIAARLATAAELGEVWEQVREAGPALGATSVALRVDAADARGRRRAHRFAEEPAGTVAEIVLTRHSLLGERPDANVLELGWTGRREIDRDTELAVEQLCRHIRGALERIATAAPAITGEERGRDVVTELRQWEAELVHPARAANAGR